MKVATIGTGFIVDWFLTAVQESANISCVAMFSRKESSARMLADKYEIDKIYTNLDDMMRKSISSMSHHRTACILSMH